MAKTLSSMLALGTTAPNFTLPDTVSGKPVTLYDGKPYAATVIVFMCNHCPFVKHIIHPLIEMAHTYIEKNIRFIAISANDATQYPEDGPVFMKQHAEDLHFPFSYLYDETQDVAKAYQATCTPDFFVFNGESRCVYCGQFDRSTPGNNIPVTGEALSRALDAILAGKPVDAHQLPSVGCNIKWKE